MMVGTLDSQSWGHCLYPSPPPCLLPALPLARSFLVTQHRQAVQVAEPAALAKLLELLIGTACIGEQLSELDKEAVAAAAAYDEEEERMEE